MKIVQDIIELKKINEEASTEEASFIIQQLKDSLPDGAYGLAAPQIGIHKKVCLLRVPACDGHRGYEQALINPVMIEQRDERVCYDEGCLSFPGKRVTTKRYYEVLVKDAMHEAGIVFTGLEAQIVQHEIDHVNSITILDRQINTAIGHAPKIGRNDLCPKCLANGVQIKYKKCKLHSER